MHHIRIHRTITFAMVGFAVLVVVPYAVFGWSDPPSAPPESSLSVPLDTSGSDQTKTGGLAVKSLTTIGAIGVGIGAPAKQLDVAGDIHASGDVCADAGGGKCLSTILNGVDDSSLNASDGDPVDALIVDADGKVGIGVPAPSYMLDIGGAMHARDDICTDAGGGRCLSALKSVGDGYSLDAADGDPVDVIFVDNNGKVGIGTALPTNGMLLDVNGVIGASKLVSRTNTMTYITFSGASVVLGANNQNLFWSSQAWYPQKNTFSDLGRSMSRWRDLWLGRNAFIAGSVGVGTTTPRSALHIPDGKYLQAEDNNAGAPPSADCDSDTERGRISLDITNFLLYVCVGAARGWDYAALSN